MPRSGNTVLYASNVFSVSHYETERQRYVDIAVENAGQHGFPTFLAEFWTARQYRAGRALAHSIPGDGKGITLEHTFPFDTPEHQQAVFETVEQLLKRGWIRNDDYENLVADLRALAEPYHFKLGPAVTEVLSPDAVPAAPDDRTRHLYAVLEPSLSHESR